MYPTSDPFQPGAIKTVRIRPSRSHALVVFDGLGVRLLDHPVAGVRRSTLMVLGGHGDLVRNKPKVLAERLVTLPEVLPVEQRGREYAEVSLISPDQLECADCTTWTIVPRRVLVDQIGAQRAQFAITSPEASDVDTVELLAPQWWHLVRVLLSLDAWMTYLGSEMDKVAQQVRRSGLFSTP